MRVMAMGISCGGDSITLTPTGDGGLAVKRDHSSACRRQHSMLPAAGRKKVLAIGWRRNGMIAVCTVDLKRRFQAYCSTLEQWRRAALRHHMLVRSTRQ